MTPFSMIARVPRRLLPALVAAALGSPLLIAGCKPASAPPAAPDTPDSPASAPASASAIAVTAPWSRQTAAGQNAGGAFMTIANTGAAADRLTGGSSPLAGRVEIHSVTMDGDVMRMRRLGDGLEVPAGGTITLKPGSVHIMLMDLKAPLEQGDIVPLTLTFAGAGAIETRLQVRPAGAMEHGAMEHADHD